MNRTFELSLLMSTAVLVMALVSVPLLYPILTTSGAFFAATAASAEDVAELRGPETPERSRAAWLSTEYRRHARVSAELDRLRTIAVRRDDTSLALLVAALREREGCHNREVVEGQPPAVITAIAHSPRPIYPTSRELAEISKQARDAIPWNQPWDAVARLELALACQSANPQAATAAPRPLGAL